MISLISSDVFAEEVQILPVIEERSVQLSPPSSVIISNVSDRCVLQGGDVGKLKWRAISTLPNKRVIQVYAVEFTPACWLLFSRTFAAENTKLPAIQLAGDADLRDDGQITVSYARFAGPIADRLKSLSKVLAANPPAQLLSTIGLKSSKD